MIFTLKHVVTKTAAGPRKALCPLLLFALTNHKGIDRYAQDFKSAIVIINLFSVIISRKRLQSAVWSAKRVPCRPSNAAGQLLPAAAERSYGPQKWCLQGNHFAGYWTLSAPGAFRPFRAQNRMEKAKMDNLGDVFGGGEHRCRKKAAEFCAADPDAGHLHAGVVLTAAMRFLRCVRRQKVAYRLHSPCPANAMMDASSAEIAVIRALHKKCVQACCRCRSGTRG